MKSKVAVLIIFLTINLGCAGGSNPSIPAPLQEPSIQHSTSSATIWGVWGMEFDEEEVAVRAVPVHAADYHVDVTHFITPPECADCLELTVLEYSTQDGVFDIEASITNPTALSGFDVRAILRWETGHIWLDNPDDYTTLFDDGGTKTLNPFIAWAKDADEREFLPSATHTREIDFRFSQTGHFGEVTFVVEASYPGHCTEPYEISDQSVSGMLIGTAPVTVECTVSDWQDDVTGVTLFPEPLADDPIAMSSIGDNRWSGVLSNVYEVDEGVYYLVIRADSPGGSQTQSIYDYLEVSVAAQPDTGLDPGPWPIIGHDPQHTARSEFDGPSSTPSLEWDSTSEAGSWGSTYAGASMGSNGRLYIATASGIFCLNSDGGLEWNEEPPFSDVVAPPQPLLTASGACIVCWSSLVSNNVEQGVYAYEMSSGSLRWSKTEFTYTGSSDEKGFSVYDTPTVTEDGIIVAVAREHVIIALDEISGTKQWLWPDDSGEYRSVLAGSYLDGWRGAPAVAPDGSVVAVADWFEDPRLIVLNDFGMARADEPLTTLTTVNCHPVVTDANEVILGGFVFDIYEASGAVEARNLDGIFLWDYVDDVIRVLQGTPGIGPDGSLYFLDGTGVNEQEDPYDNHVYLLVLSRFGQFINRWPIFTRVSAGQTSVTHFRNGVSVGDDNTVYVSTGTRSSTLGISYITGVAAINPIFGNVIWTYGRSENESSITSFYGTPVIGPDGTLYVGRYDRLLALK
jgi:outer membrane protein assembly factor BamB